MTDLTPVDRAPATRPGDHDPEVVRLVADAIRDSGMKDAFFDDSAGSWEVGEKPWQYENAARVVLDDLAAAGLTVRKGDQP